MLWSERTREAHVSERNSISVLSRLLSRGGAGAAPRRDARARRSECDAESALRGIGHVQPSGIVQACCLPRVRGLAVAVCDVSPAMRVGRPCAAAGHEAVAAPVVRRVHILRSFVWFSGRNCGCRSGWASRLVVVMSCYVILCRVAPSGGLTVTVAVCMRLLPLRG